MAQRTIHYLFGEILSREVTLRDKGRFLLGSVLPDAFSEASQRDLTHFTNKDLPNSQIYFDFTAFRNQFGSFIQADDFYAGYYMHLVEDDFYRQFLRKTPLKDNLPRSQQEVARLHRDYHLLNAYIVRRYQIRNRLVLPADFQTEPINRIAHFTLDRFLEDMQHDFTETPQGDTYFLTETMLDQFVEQYIPLAVKELTSLFQGTYYLNAIDYAWTKSV